jgi:nitrogen regulatory protein PII
MIKLGHASSVVTAILPGSSAHEAANALHDSLGLGVLSWGARGTLLQDQWWKRWVPPISPAKTVLQLLAPSHEVDAVERTIIEAANLDKQSTGAIYSTPCMEAYVGDDFDAWQVDWLDSNKDDPVKMPENLMAIHCIVGHQDSERISRAAIHAGAHGPIVYYSEGRGLRDRLGWLRITKEPEKEVLTVIVEEEDCDAVFDAMADAGNLHLPGRGFMYVLPISKGMYNLRNRTAAQQHNVSMQQIVNAIDHLAGHSHWRDDAVVDAGVRGRATGLANISPVVPLNNQVCLSAICHREDASAMMDLMLEAGAPGLNVNYARYSDGMEKEATSVTRLCEEYANLRCITHGSTAQEICRLLDAASSKRHIADFCTYLVKAPRVATYVPGKRDYRAA